mmetsp:Transcript_32960/g.71187  ORF Transcript_32960/g.71187 Transcript_32960/m.71187 type:complete len:251 (-) Transcript_32960:88-840(-)
MGGSLKPGGRVGGAGGSVDGTAGSVGGWREISSVSGGGIEGIASVARTSCVGEPHIDRCVTGRLGGSVGGGVTIPGATANSGGRSTGSEPWALGFMRLNRSSETSLTCFSLNALRMLAPGGVRSSSNGSDCTPVLMVTFGPLVSGGRGGGGSLAAGTSSSTFWSFHATCRCSVAVEPADGALSTPAGRTSDGGTSMASGQELLRGRRGERGRSGGDGGGEGVLILELKSAVVPDIPRRLNSRSLPSSLSI